MANHKTSPARLSYNIAYFRNKPLEAIKKILSVWDRAKYESTYDETFIQGVYSPLIKILKPKTLLLDLGGNIGDTAIYFAQFKKIFQVIAYEKNYKIWKRGNANIVRSPYSSKIDFLFEEATPSNLKEMLLLFSNSNIAIKCDIDGAELALFKNLELPKNVYAVILETHDTNKPLSLLFKKQGFKVYYQYQNQGIIFKELGIMLAYRPGPYTSKFYG